MKKCFFIFVILTMASIIDADACAICGCGTGNYYLGIMPQYKKNFIGFRYLHYSFTSHIGEGYKPFEATSETFQTTELWMRFYPTDRLQVLTLIDYNFNKQIDQGVTKYLQGVGDIPLIVNYNILNTTYQPLSESRVFNHNIFLGGGIKLPTGRYKFEENISQVSNANFQLGTGSVDFIATANYTIRHKRFGLSNDFNYKFNGKNHNDYKFGNRFSGTTTLFYIQQFRKLGLMPNAGMYFENSAKNNQYGVNIDNTGGSAYLLTAGADAYYKKMAIGINFQTPVSQNLANHHSETHGKIMMHVSFMF
jgi:hypothetical protein